MNPDPKWLEILKASGWQTAAISIACTLFLLIANWNWIPTLEPWMFQLAAAGALLCGCLAVASLINSIFRFFPIQRWLIHWINIYREQRAVRNYIPHMTNKERDIIAYLLAKNQKTFTAEADCGHAITLRSRNIVLPAFQRGQIFDATDMPMIIPDHIWKVLQKHKDQFPYSPPESGEVETYPWRVHWMLR